jgi:hypothetical protein
VPRSPDSSRALSISSRRHGRRRNGARRRKTGSRRENKNKKLFSAKKRAAVPKIGSRNSRRKD